MVEPVPPEELVVGLAVLAHDPMSGTVRVGIITNLREEANGFREVTVTPPGGEESPRDFLVAPEGQPSMSELFRLRAMEEEPSPPASQAEEQSEDVVSPFEPPASSYESPPPSPGRESNPSSKFNTPARRGGRRKTKRSRRGRFTSRHRTNGRQPSGNRN